MLDWHSQAVLVSPFHHIRQKVSPHTFPRPDWKRVNLNQIYLESLMPCTCYLLPSKLSSYHQKYVCEPSLCAHSIRLERKKSQNFHILSWVVHFHSFSPAESTAPGPSDVGVWKLLPTIKSRCVLLGLGPNNSQVLHYRYSFHPLQSTRWLYGLCAA